MQNYEDRFESWADSVLYPTKKDAKKKILLTAPQQEFTTSILPPPPPVAPVLPMPPQPGQPSIGGEQIAPPATPRIGQTGLQPRITPAEMARQEITGTLMKPLSVLARPAEAIREMAYEPVRQEQRELRMKGGGEFEPPQPLSERLSKTLAPELVGKLEEPAPETYRKLFKKAGIEAGGLPVWALDIFADPLWVTPEAFVKAAPAIKSFTSFEKAHILSKVFNTSYAEAGKLILKSTEPAERQFLEKVILSSVKKNPQILEQILEKAPSGLERGAIVSKEAQGGIKILQDLRQAEQAPVGLREVIGNVKGAVGAGPEETGIVDIAVAGRDLASKAEMSTRGALKTGTSEAGVIDIGLSTKLKTPIDLPKSDEFINAVRNTPNAEITPEGLKLSLFRRQAPEQAGELSVRTGVFYKPSKEGFSYTGKYGYGGSEVITGDTLLKKPLFVKGATGGKAPEIAYDTIKGKGSYQKMRTDVRDNIGTPWKPVTIQDIKTILNKYGGDSNVAGEIFQLRNKGNNLSYAIQENIVANEVRNAGYDAIVGYSIKRDKTPFLSEVFDLRESGYPIQGEQGMLHPKFEPSAAIPEPVKPPSTIGKIDEIRQAETIIPPKQGITTTKPVIAESAPKLQQGAGQPPPQKPPAPATGPAVPNEWNEFHDLLKAGRLNEAEQKIPLIKGNMSKQSALEFLEDAKAELIDAEKYYEQFPKIEGRKPKPEMLSYDEVYPTKYEMDIAKEQALNKHIALRDKTLALVESKELSNDTMARIRRGLNIGSIKKASTPQLEELHTFVSRLEKGDKFVSPKQSEALAEILKDIEHPELTPKRIIIDRFGDKEEVLSKGILGKIPNQLIPTVDIKEGHPLITRIVNKADDFMWEAENKTSRRLTKFDEMLSGAEKSRPERGIKEKLLKTNPEIFDALSGKQVDLTAQERGVVAYLRNFFAKAKKDLELDKFRKNYVTHIEQGLEEKIWNQGIKKTVAEMIGKRPNAPNIPTEIMSALDDIIGSEKFFKYSQKRTGALNPTQNLRKILQEYSTVYERVMALNKVLPEGQAIQQLLLQPKSAQWMKRYLQNLKGRALDFEFRNGKAAWLANVGDKIVDIGFHKLLGGNYWSALKNLVAGEANSFITTPFKSYLTGKARFMLSPKKALKMAKEYGVLNDMYYEYATTGFKGVPRKLERYSMVGQAIGETEIRTSMLLAELTPEEWAKGAISMGRRRQVLDKVAQTQGIFSKTQSPLLVQTTPGRMIFQMNRWRITNSLLVRRLALAAGKDMKSGLMNTQNTRNLAKMFMLYSSGMYLSYELGKAGYKQAAKVAQSMAETVNNIVELVTTDTLVRMFTDNPSFSVLGELAYTAQELAAYIGVPGIQEPRKITFRKGIEDTYIAPYERTMELIGANDDVSGDKSDEFEKMFEKELGISSPEDDFEKAMGIK